MDASSPAPRLVRFTEGSEGAFSLVLPDTWSAQGGVARGPADPRPWYRVVSPGGGAELRGSDPRVPPTFLDPGYGAYMPPLPGMVLRPYTPPEGFADEYARNFARELGASSFVGTGVRDVETILRDDPRPATRPRVLTMLQQGAALGGVTFACPDRGLCGQVDVLTLRMPGPAGLGWAPFVTALIGPAAQWPHVKASLLQIAHTYTANPAWQQQVGAMQQAQHQATMDSIAAGTRVLQMQAQSGMEAIRAHAQRAQMSAMASAETDAMRADAWRAQQASDDERHRRAVNAVRETVDLYDPASGQVYRGAPAGYATFWTDGADRVVASEGHENPDPTRFTQAENLDELRGRPGRG